MGKCACLYASSGDGGRDGSDFDVVAYRLGCPITSENDACMALRGGAIDIRVRWHDARTIAPTVGYHQGRADVAQW